MNAGNSHLAVTLREALSSTREALKSPLCTTVKVVSACLPGQGDHQAHLSKWSLNLRPMIFPPSKDGGTKEPLGG